MSEPHTPASREPAAPQLPLFRFRTLADLRHGISTRHGGVSRPPFASLNLGYSTADEEQHVAVNRDRLAAALAVPPERVLSAWLTHGTEVAVFRAGAADSWPVQQLPLRRGGTRRGQIFRCDAVVSDVANLFFLLTFADCVPLLFIDRVRGVVAAAHAGWRGTAAGIGPAVVASMAGAFGCRPGDITAGIGPSIGPCCYTVGREVTEAFERHESACVAEQRNGATYLDLWSSNQQQLVNSGVATVAIEVAGICTACQVDTFFSHRAEAGTTGRFGLCFGIAGDASP